MRCERNIQDEKSGEVNFKQIDKASPVCKPVSQSAKGSIGNISQYLPIYSSHDFWEKLHRYRYLDD